MTGFGLGLAFLGAVLVVCLTALVGVAIWILRTPAREEQAARDARRRQGLEALTRGLLAAAGGDGALARREAEAARTLGEEAPGLLRLLDARTAEAEGDSRAIEVAYSAMLPLIEMRLAGHRGLRHLALTRGDAADALRHAEAAFALSRSAPWAWRAILEARLAAGDWQGGLGLIEVGLEREIVSPEIAARARAAVETAEVATLEAAAAPEPPPARALDRAVLAAEAHPDFTPAAVVAARLLTLGGETARAEAIIDTAWRARPHPALWRAWRDLRTDETPEARAGRLGRLATLDQPASREVHFLRVEQALVVGDGFGARDAAEALAGQPLTHRLADLRARISLALGRPAEARSWLAQAADAPGEADWSDIGPGGRAFVYSAVDWARIVVGYAERGELLHPRFDRGEGGYGELPRVPEDYVESEPFTPHPWRLAEGSDAGFPPVDADDEFGAILAAAPVARRARALGGWFKGR